MPTSSDKASRAPDGDPQNAPGLDAEASIERNPELKSPKAFIVGIGASAGGLDALNALLARATPTGAAFVVIQHLAPNQKSLLTELLGRATTLRVLTVEEGMRVGENCVYVAPPNADLAILDGIFHILTPVAGTHPHLPIDSFLRSLADERGSASIGVVLSGTGTDGTFGLAAIKAAGGITFAQEPATAKFDGMPRSAIESGSADFVLPPEDIADEIARVCNYPYIRRTSPFTEFQEYLGSIAVLIKNAFGLDLTHYKPNTIERRIQRRMAVHRLERIGDYVRLCQRDANELATLHKDLLINVTNFFRDGEPFEALKADILPRILERKKDSDSFRVWVPGCSSGEEAYSIGICLIELLEERELALKVQIFGTDIDQDAIQQARRGIYPLNIVADVSPERLRRFFVKTEDNRYQITRRIRDMVVFSVQNVTRDAPFSRLDLVSCRNLLIYLLPGIQKKVLRTLHYALNPESFLMLGTSESIGDAADWFALIDRKNKIYSAKHVALTHAGFELGTGVAPLNPTREGVQLTAARPMISIAHLADRKILEDFAPSGVVINDNFDILYFRGRSSSYLEHPSGVATHNIFRLIRPELHPPLKNAIERVQATNEPVTADAQVKDGPGFRPLTLIVQPILEPETKARCLLVLFKEPQHVSGKPLGQQDPPEGDEHARVLAQELALTKDYLQSTIEELERSNEDLKSANEELQSSNEELQSTNEELETSKEELQSTNEELITLNEELQNRMRDLSASNDDLHNVLLGVDRPLVIVGLDYRIRRFTTAAEKLLNLVPTDIGRSASQLNAFAGGLHIEQLLADCIEHVSPVEQEVLAVDRHRYLVRVMPYKTLDLNIRGALINIARLGQTVQQAGTSAPDASTPLLPDSAAEERSQ